MITVLSRKPDDLASPDVSKVNKEIIEYCGLSTDEKPNGLIVTGSTFLEIDTGDLYIYNEEAAEWVQFINIKDAAGGGGGGSAKYETAIMSLTFTGESFQDFYIYETLEKGVCGYIHPVSCYVSESEEVIKAPAIKVVFDGVTYNNLTMNLEDNSYGTSTSSPDWTEYPFFIMFNNEEIVIGVADSNEHSIAVYLEVMLGTVTLTNKTGDDIYTSFSTQYYAIPDDTTKTLPVLLEGGLGVIYFGNQPSSDYTVAGENAGYSPGQQGLVVYDQPASVNLNAGE